MASITVISRKQYSGPAADRTSVTGAAGDTYTATDTGVRYTWDPNASAWIVGAGSSAIVRETNAYDWEWGDLTNNNTWIVNGLDLTGIVPVGTIMVQIEFAVKGAVNKIDYIRKNAVDTKNLIRSFRKVSNYWEYNNAWIGIDADRLLDYRLDFVADFDITVLGYII